MIERAEFGRTGHQSSRVIFGAAALGAMRQERADTVLDSLLELGINHVDTAASYGESELRLAPWLVQHRTDVFLATKTGGRTGEGARASLERSLERLGVDHVDLIQLHNLVEDDEWDVAHGRGGAVEALAAARDEGLVRFIGVTGHGTRIAGAHLRSLERFDFDSVLFPYNFSLLRDGAYRGDVETLLELCADRRVAVQTIKAVARRRWTADDKSPHFSWYEPLPAGPALARAVRFVLARPQLFLNTSSDARLLRAIAEAASGPVAAPSDEEMDADMAEFAVRPLFDGGAFKEFKLRPMDYADHVAAIEHDTHALLAAFGEGPFDQPVPTCPGWSVADLATHVGEFTGFWTHVLCEGTGRPKSPFADLAAGEDVVDWYRGIADALVNELRETPPHTRVWTWKPDDQSARFVGRRVANELAVHRYDAQSARGHAEPIDTALATDGIDEMLMMTNALDRDSPAHGQGQTLHVHGTDDPEEWLITMGANGVAVERRHAKGDLALRGAVSDLELVLYHRPPLGPVEHFGDESVLAVWYEVFTF